MSFRGVGLFTSSPLSAPPSSPRKHPIASTSLIPMDEESEDEDDVDQEMANTGDDADESADTSQEESAVAAEYEVEAIIARKGGYNGKTLMYLIRWKGYGPEADTWEPRSNISADDLIAEFEAKNLRAQPKSSRRDSKIHKTPSSKSRLRHNTSNTVASTSASASKPRSSVITSSVARRKPISRLERDNNAKSFFWQDPPYKADEFILPVSSLVCDAAWTRIRSYINKTSSSSSTRKLVVIHPATLVRLRTQTAHAKLNTYFRAGLKETVQLVKENEYTLLGNGSFPVKNIFRDASLSDILSGGEGYRLTWPWGLEDPDHEFAHIVATLQHLPGLLEGKIKCRLIVRNVQPNMAEACTYFGIDIVDAQSFIKGF